MKKITILGATGSVGRQMLDVALQYPEKLEIVCLSAHTHVEDLAQLVNEVRPKYAALTGNGDIDKLKSLIRGNTEVISGKKALVEACSAGDPDLVALSVLGIAGLPAFEECLKRRTPVALANKESLVCGADITRRMMDETGTLVLPVDSEHSAIFQCLGNKYDVSDVRKLWITASGGPFLDWTKEEIEKAPKSKALKHPKWSMGQKITIDSASLANKGLEVIEAHFMYGMPSEQIKVLIHPQSMVHSLVEFKDNSVQAQLGPVDMRMPIQKALLYPEMLEARCTKSVDFYEISRLDFREPDFERFPCLKLAYDSIGLQTTAIFNTANEAAVALYLDEKISFGRIAELISESMERFCGIRPANIEEILDLDSQIRRYVGEIV
ncbi:MAG: 1-deoxy-D-xylulose-5-phosphate reductoisomerase [Christensenella sp.]|nr:1-deoxy-D-xylulose-5-phosphate reductoisomerase [Christensenella sp.]